MVQEVRRQFREIPGIMEYKAKPEYEKCVAISTKASIREMMLPGGIALITPVIVGFVFGPEVLGGLLAGVTVSGVLMGIFQSNAGGAWDNAKKSFEKGVNINGEMFYKKSEPHKASVTGDTVGDPFKDTSGPSMNILIKLMSIVSLVIAPYIAVVGTAESHGNMLTKEVIRLNINGEEMDFTSKAQADSAIAANMKSIDEVKGLYVVDGVHSSVDFSVKHIITYTKGTVLIDSGFVNFDNTKGPKIYARLDMTSLKTQSDMRDDHLKNKETFFNVPKFPKAVFEASEIVKNEENMMYPYIAKGKLTMKGVTKDVELRFKYVGTNEVEENYTDDKGVKVNRKVAISGFEGEMMINRDAFGIGGGGSTEDVKVEVTLEAQQERK